MDRPATRQDTPPPRISIVIVNYNSLIFLKELLASIEVYPPRAPYEIIVVDNASTDETAQWCVEAPLELRLIVNPHNCGFAAAANIGAEMARGDLLLFCNPDLRWLSPVADQLAECIREHRRCAAATARLTFPDRSFQPSCRRFPTFANIWFSRGSPLARIMSPPGTSFVYTLPEYEQPTRVDAASATCLMVSRTAFQELGGFDERFFMFAEDTDLCRRLAIRGKEIWFVPAATAIHHWGGSSIDRRTVSRHHLRSLKKYFQKHYPRAIIRNMLLSAALSLLELATPWGKDRA
jgi:GT2 family glycosyltransferase